MNRRTSRRNKERERANQELKSNRRGIQERNQEKRSPRGRKFIIITVEACAVLLSIHIQNERRKTTTTEEEEQQRKQHHHGCGTSNRERERDGEKIDNFEENKQQEQQQSDTQIHTPVFTHLNTLEKKKDASKKNELYLRCLD